MVIIHMDLVYNSHSGCYKTLKKQKLEMQLFGNRIPECGKKKSSYLN